MANLSGKVTILPGYTTALGNKGAAVAQIKGINGYQAGVTLQQQNRQSFGLRGIEFVGGSSFTVSGTYFVVWQPSGLGASASLILRWFRLIGGIMTEVAGPTNLSAETVQILVVGG